jgi:hypothetical protein
MWIACDLRTFLRYHVLVLELFTWNLLKSEFAESLDGNVSGKSVCEPPLKLMTKFLP